MKLGDVVEVRNIQTGEKPDATWARGRVLRVKGDGTVDVQVDHEGHKFHGKVLTADAEHLRVPEQKEE